VPESLRPEGDPCHRVVVVTRGAVIEIGLLGSPRVRVDGAPVAFDTRKATALLAVLALSPTARPRDALADLLWPGSDLERARGALRRTLSTLRSGLGPTALATDRDTVRLVTGPDLVVDVHLFHDLVARDELDRAAALAGGDLLEGFRVRDAPGFEAWAETEAAGLRSDLLGVLARLTDRLEAAGDHRAALRTARRWLASDELQEPAHRAVIRLLAASGDRAGALRQYRECVRTLSRELGVAPLPETTRLYEQVGAGRAGHAPTARPSGAEPVDEDLPATLPFVGRERELGALVAVHDGVRAGDGGQVVLVDGDVGIGKTRLIEELAARVRRQGGRVLTLRCFEDESHLAYAPVVELLAARLRADPGALDGLGAADRRDADRLLGLAPPGEVVPSGPGAEARFLGAVWQALAQGVSGEVPGLLVLDDAQWADEATASLVAFGRRRLAGARVVVLVVWRTPHTHRLPREIAVAAHRGHGAVVHVAPLDLPAVTRLARAARPAAAGSAMVRRLLETTHGVPLLLLEYLRGADPSDDEWDVPPAVQDLVRDRLARLGEVAGQVLAAAAVLGRSFDHRTVQAVSGRSEEETAEAVDELVRRGLVRESPQGYDFGHDQVRLVAYDDAGAARRRLLHGRAADALALPAARARHLELAGRAAQAARAHAVAAEQAVAVHANAAAQQHLRSALALGHPDPARLHADLGDLLVLDGDYPGAVTAYETAAADAGPALLPGVEHRLGRVHHRRGDWALAGAHLDAALDGADEDDHALRARVVSDRSLTSLDAGDPVGAGALSLQALEAALRSGDALATSRAHNVAAVVATTRGDHDVALTHLADSRRLAERADDLDALVAALNNTALVHRAQGLLEPATRLTREALGLCVRAGDRHREAALRNNLADLLHAAGEGDEAMAELKQAVALFADVGAQDEPVPAVWKLVRW
jgi:DNA-binding SARP family transcriptional activator/tetratricopeptide (TPR) repeat protein